MGSKDIPREWVESVYWMSKQRVVVEARIIGEVQVSPEWYEAHGQPRTVWGIPITVDPLLFGDGGRVVPK